MVQAFYANFKNKIIKNFFISEKVIEKGEVKIYFNKDNISKIIHFSESRLFFINKQYGITIIEIKDDDGFEFDNFQKQMIMKIMKMKYRYYNI